MTGHISYILVLLQAKLRSTPSSVYLPSECFRQPRIHVLQQSQQQETQQFS